MVKPLNKEWALFGPKYRVPGAKGEKVDCHACQKQVSAAVNRLQSHLRVCPARPLAADVKFADATTASLDDDGTGGSSTAVAVVHDAVVNPHDNDHSLHDSDATMTAADADAVPAAPLKRPRPTAGGTATATLTAAPAAQRLRVSEDAWIHASATAYAKRRLEIEEQRLQLELERAHRERKRDQYELEILAAQARKEKVVAEKAVYDARVLLALSRKQLRDQGVDEHEIDRVLPVDVLVARSTIHDGDEATATETETAPIEEDASGATSVETVATAAPTCDDETDQAVL